MTFIVVSEITNEFPGLDMQPKLLPSFAHNCFHGGFSAFDSATREEVVR